MSANRIMRSPIRNQFKKFNCKYCGKYFKLKWSLDEHVRCYHPSRSIYMEPEDKVFDNDGLYDIE